DRRARSERSLPTRRAALSRLRPWAPRSRYCTHAANAFPVSLGRRAHGSAIHLPPRQSLAESFQLRPLDIEEPPGFLAIAGVERGPRGVEQTGAAAQDADAEHGFFVAAGGTLAP